MYTGFKYSIPFDQTIKLIADAGFTVTALGGVVKHSRFDTKTGRANIQKLLQNHNLTLNSVHSPLPHGALLFSPDEVERLEAVRQCKFAVDAADELNGRIVVLHLIHTRKSDDEIWNKMIDNGRKSIDELAHYANRATVKLALENSIKPEYDEVLSTMLNEFTAPHIGFCYDTGHEHAGGRSFQILEEFGDRLFTTHIHDNDGTADLHSVPYEGSLDWKRFKDVMKNINYSGNLLFETDMVNSQYKDPAEFLARVKEVADNFSTHLTG